ncbi:MULTISPECIES: hypothetical protein [unclassified Marinobacter]|uniref:hypothetical protein n=1 Tax=unclassified Marinobacter TaxID=83889 RepID=UPI00190623DF|nr:hypothetical protein [Marinobacter sp. 1-4A]MBK1852542.1 hypothetical protein [Marinobacter sp. 1-4A]
MAFDMYIGKYHESIGDEDEYILSMIRGSESEFPQLSKVSLNYYGDLTFTPVEASALVHELMKLSSQNRQSNTAMKLLILRLASFFSIAVQTNQEVNCAGD